jgi:hypothetical protein
MWDTVYLGSGCIRRRGISLLEVLISMFVLLIGLVGVGAMIPAGRFEILQGVKLDYASMVGREAFRDLKVRGYLNPNNWYNASGTNVFNGTTFTSTSGFVAIDPLGMTSPTLATGFGATFPYGASPTLSLTRISPMPVDTTSTNYTKIASDPIFRCPDDLNLTPHPKGVDYPPFQSTLPVGNPQINPSTLAPMLAPIKRASQGNYSWLATIVPDPNPSVLPTSSKMIVSVAVIYKRDLSTAGTSERTATVSSFNGIGEATLTLLAQPLRPGQWVMLAGTAQAGAPPTTWNYIRWYRVVAADSPVPALPAPGPYTQYVTLAGPDWLPTAPNTTIWIIDNVIAVYEKNMKLELP